jgi:hypothetical protein
MQILFNLSECSGDVVSRDNNYLNVPQNYDKMKPNDINVSDIIS